MVFGWGKKKEEKRTQHEPSDQIKEISLSDVPSVLLEEKKSRQSQAILGATPRFETIRAEIGAISAIVTHLEGDDLNLDDVDTRLRVIVSRGKSEVVAVISKETKVQISKIESYESMARQTESVSHTLRKIGDVLGKNSRIIHIFAKKYANDLKMHLETITANHAEILKMIKGVDEFESTESVIKDKIQKHTALADDISKNTSRLSRSQELLQKHVQRIGELEKEIGTLRASAGHAQFLQLRQDLTRLLELESEFNKEIDDEFSKISRPLGKYVYVTSLDKPLKSLLEDLIQSPSRMLTKENKIPIVTVLESCMKGVISGTVSIKGNEKTVDQIAGLISSIDTLVERKMSHSAKIDQVREKMALFDLAGLEGLERQLELAKTDKETTESKIKTLQSDLEQQKKDRQYMLEHISDLMQTALGTKCVVVE